MSYIEMYTVKRGYVVPRYISRVLRYLSESRCWPYHAKKEICMIKPAIRGCAINSLFVKSTLAAVAVAKCSIYLCDADRVVICIWFITNFLLV